MGMFNEIETGPSCPNCGAKVEWQSKNLSIRGYPIENPLIRIAPEPDMDGEMHTLRLVLPPTGRRHREGTDH